jgi:DNA-directed RNA polymerase subunit RPC12/RpoP
MSAGKLIGYIIAAILIFFGVLFIWGAGDPQQGGGASWVVTGIISVGLGLGIIALIKFREPKPAQPPQEIVQKIDLSGDIEMEKLKCRECGAELEKESITVEAGAIMIDCPYCGSTYQVVEEPKW